MVLGVQWVLSLTIIHIYSQNINYSLPIKVCTASWDHTIKIWDLEMGGMKSELVGNKSFFGLSYSHLNHTVITASADRTIR